jgi:hypothetical protein
VVPGSGGKRLQPRIAFLVARCTQAVELLLESRRVSGPGSRCTECKSELTYLRREIQGVTRGGKRKADAAFGAAKSSLPFVGMVDANLAPFCRLRPPSDGHLPVITARDCMTIRPCV